MFIMGNMALLWGGYGIFSDLLILLFLHRKIHYVANSKVKVGLYVYGTSNESWRTVIFAGLEADPARASTSAQSTTFESGFL